MYSAAERILAIIEKSGLKAQGRAELTKHLEGGRLSALAAIKAKCYDCMGYMADGKEDCGVTHCPLHPKMPYNPGKEKKERTLTEEQRKAMSDRFKK